MHSGPVMPGTITMCRHWRDVFFRMSTPANDGANDNANTTSQQAAAAAAPAVLTRTAVTEVAVTELGGITAHPASPPAPNVLIERSKSTSQPSEAWNLDPASDLVLSEVHVGTAPSHATQCTTVFRARLQHTRCRHQQHAHPSQRHPARARTAALEVDDDGDVIVPRRQRVVPSGHEGLQRYRQCMAASAPGETAAKEVTLGGSDGSDTCTWDHGRRRCSCGGIAEPIPDISICHSLATPLNDVGAQVRIFRQNKNDFILLSTFLGVESDCLLLHLPNVHSSQCVAVKMTAGMGSMRRTSKHLQILQT